MPGVAGKAEDTWSGRRRRYERPAGRSTMSGYLFRTARGRSKELTDYPMSQADAYRMIRRRAAGVKILTRIGCHSFRATGITEYLRNGGMLEVAQQMGEFRGQCIK